MAILNGVNLSTPFSPGSGSTDIAFEVINANETGSLFRIGGDGATTISGSLTVTGSLTAGSFTGSITGTSSYATQALSASYSTTALTASNGSNTFTIGSNKIFSQYNSGGTANDALKLSTTNLGATFGVQNTNASGFSGIEYIDNSNAVKVFTGYNNSGTGEFRFNNIASNGFITFKILSSDKLTIANTGNVGIGTVSPTAKLHVAAPGALSTDIGFKVRNSADTADIITVAGNGNVNLENLTLQRSTNLQIQLAWQLNQGAGNSITVYRNNYGVGDTIRYSSAGLWNPSGVGTSNFAGFSFTDTIAQTGSSTGTSRALYVNPILTSATDWRSIEWTNNTGFGLYGSGDAVNYLKSGLGIGKTSPNAKLDVSGSAIVSGSLTVTGATTAASVTAPSIVATSGMSIQQPAGQYYPSIGFYNNGGAFQGNITGYNGKLLTTNVIVQANYSLGVGFAPFDSIYAQSQVLAKSALSTDNSFAVVNNPKTGYHLKVNNAGNVQTGVGGLSIPRTDTPDGTLLSTITYATTGLTRFSTGLDVSGSTIISGSLTVTQGITGSLLGTSSYATQALSSSYADTASYYGGSVTSASYATTASYVLNAVSASYTTQALSASFATSTAAVAGTTNYIPKFASANTLGNSVIFESGSNIGIGTITPTAKLEVNGEILTKSSNPLFTLRDSDNDINAMYLGADFNFSAGTISYTSLSVNRNPANGVFFNTARAGAQINLESSNNNGTIGFYTSNLNNTTPSLSMVINQLGYVGIGQTPPTARLDVRAQGALSTDLALRVRNSTNTADLLSVQGNGITNLGILSTTGDIFINEPANGLLEINSGGGINPALYFHTSNSGTKTVCGFLQGDGNGWLRVMGGTRLNIGTGTGFAMSVFSNQNVSVGTSSDLSARFGILAQGALSTDITFKVRNSAGTADLFNVVGTGQVSVFNNSTNSSLSSMDSTNTFAAVTLENFSLVNTTFKKVLGIQSYAGSGLRYLTMSSLDDLHWNHRFTVAGRLTATAGIACINVSNDFNSSTISNLYGVNLINQASISMRPDFNLALTENNLGLFIAPANTLNPTKKLIKLMDSTLTNTFFTVNGLGQVGIGTSSPTKTLQVVGTTSLSSSFNTASSGSTLTVYGSGSAQPVFTVQGSQGELFSVTDSLSGSLFSVNDISGLPIMEVFSDNTTLMGSYQDPMLITTTKVTQTNSGSFTVYSLPTASYDTAFFEYSIRSGSNARAGTIMAMQLGSTVNFTETTTTDFGSTSAVSFTVIVTGSNMALTGSSTSGAWTIKTIVRGI